MCVPTPQINFAVVLRFARTDLLAKLAAHKITHSTPTTFGKIMAMRYYQLHYILYPLKRPPVYRRYGWEYIAQNRQFWPKIFHIKNVF
jgi:hypothetical protein